MCVYCSQMCLGGASRRNAMHCLRRQDGDVCLAEGAGVCHVVHRLCNSARAAENQYASCGNSTQHARGCCRCSKPDLCQAPPLVSEEPTWDLPGAPRGLQAAPPTIQCSAASGMHQRLRVYSARSHLVFVHVQEALLLELRCSRSGQQLAACLGRAPQHCGSTSRQPLAWPGK